MTGKSIRAAALAATAAVVMSAAAPAVAATSPYPMQTKTYGKRYCEMAAVFLDGKVDVYNTWAHGYCPDADWASATSNAAMDKAKADLGALAIVPNGPRWWAFDSIGGVLGTQDVSFGSLVTNRAAILNFPTLSRPPAYTPFTVQRTSTWVYNKGTYLRVLTSPTGKKYAMQSWTTQISTKVKASTVNTLNKGKHPLITLPLGWSFNAYKAPAKLTIVAPGTMTILQDSVNNVYSLIN